jgi:hypothetical protein
MKRTGKIRVHVYSVDGQQWVCIDRGGRVELLYCIGEVQ